MAKLVKPVNPPSLPKPAGYSHGIEVQGGNAIIGMHYDANDVAPGVTEVLAYSTVVVIEPPPPR